MLGALQVGFALQAQRDINLGETDAGSRLADVDGEGRAKIEVLRCAAGLGFGYSGREQDQTHDQHKHVQDWVAEKIAALTVAKHSDGSWSGGDIFQVVAVGASAMRRTPVTD